MATSRRVVGLKEMLSAGLVMVRMRPTVVGAVRPKGSEYSSTLTKVDGNASLQPSVPCVDCELETSFGQRQGTIGSRDRGRCRPMPWPESASGDVTRPEP